MSSATRTGIRTIATAPLQGDSPGLVPMLPRTPGRFIELERMHPERRREFLRPTDSDARVITEYLSHNPERRHEFLDRAVRDGRVLPTGG